MAKWYKRLKKARIANKLSLGAAVELLYQEYKIRMHRENLYKLEQGQTEIPVHKFRSLCELYQVPPNWILDLEYLSKKQPTLFN